MIAAPTSHKSVRGWLLAALCPILAWACAADRGGPPPDRDPAFEAADWGEDRPGTAGRGSATRGGETSPRSTIWTIVLATFPNPGHEQAAANSLRQVSTIDAALAGGAWVHTGATGSLVAYGRYESTESEDAQRDLAWIKQLTLGGFPAFPKAMLSRVNLRPAAGVHDPLALMSARLRHPNVDPLYTLEVAVWGDFESGKLSLQQIHRKAEEQARTLRARGFEAYYHHHDDRRLSMVTVGLFDNSAIDQRTGLYGPAVDALLREFPAHLVNGEELLEPIDGRRLERGTRVQRPVLVLVPKL
ncbi:MAG: hypothetical protein ACYS1E_15940 [Planctomycetota bacterium]|jgi:hypothetical protein